MGYYYYSTVLICVAVHSKNDTNSIRLCLTEGQSGKKRKKSGLDQIARRCSPRDRTFLLLKLNNAVEEGQFTFVGVLSYA